MYVVNELERFMRDVEADEDLAKRFGTVANRIALANKNLSEAEVKARAMSELGYKVTATQLEIAAAEKELLDDDELEQVAGGGGTTDILNVQVNFKAAKFLIAGAQTTVAIHTCLVNRKRRFLI